MIPVSAKAAGWAISSPATTCPPSWSNNERTVGSSFAPSKSALSIAPWKVTNPACRLIAVCKAQAHAAVAPAHAQDRVDVRVTERVMQVSQALLIAARQVAVRLQHPGPCRYRAAPGQPGR
ncbi:hypothetical protein WR25_23729 [Diploscapter pachys]|uniref:Uncharacterized protein n=1 Tax=Diploscapter pachys TaxID=2018661 RepID=A0A2A2K742_9BILA|nr:hypothetical protein WR25_23729 [Diploscapter pachys]